MTNQVKLVDIVEGMVMDSNEGLVLLHTFTGTVVYLDNVFLRKAEDDEPYGHLPEWQQEQMVLAIDVLEHEENYISLPSKFDINEYGMMEDFCFMHAGCGQEQLLNAIRGSGAFRRFKDKIYDLDLEDAWYTFLDESYKQKAIDFCKYHKLKYV